MANLPDGFDFIGMIKLYAGKTTKTPPGWLPCEGQILEISGGFNALFQVIGTTYGGDGKTHFALPDLRGRVPVGPGSSPDPANTELGDIAAGTQGGTREATITLATLPSHSHGARAKASGDAADTIEPKGNLLAKPVASSTAIPNEIHPMMYAGAIGLTNLATNNPMLVRAMNDQGQTADGKAHNNIQPSIGLRYLICYSGIFPPRP